MIGVRTWRETCIATDNFLVVLDVEGGSEMRKKKKGGAQKGLCTNLSETSQLKYCFLVRSG